MDTAQELVQRLGSAPEAQKRGGTLAKIRSWIKSAVQEIANAHLLLEDGGSRSATAVDVEDDSQRHPSQTDLRRKSASASTLAPSSPISQLVR